MITWSRGLICWVLHQVNGNELKTLAITLLQVKTNLTISENLTKTILFGRKIFRKNSPITACTLIRLAQKTAIRNSNKISRKAAKKTALATLISDKRSHVVWLTAASKYFQEARFANFPTLLSFYSCVTMERESSIHSAWSVLLRMLLEWQLNLQYVAMTTDLTFRKIFDLWWTDNFHVEMDLMWFWG